MVFHVNRTKWKRQNQLRLEQLRHQASMDKEMLSSNDHNSNTSFRLFFKTIIFVLFFPTLEFPLSMIFVNLFLCCQFTAPTPMTSMTCCPSTSLPSFSPSSSCTFLTSAAAAAAIFRNVGYVHGCPL